MRSSHDQVVHDFLTEKETAESLFREYLPVEITKHLDFSTLELSKDSFVDKKLARHYSDLLYKTSIADMEAYLYFLIEHKSSPETLTGFQLLRYIVRIWELFLKQNKGVESLPPVIPIVLYHGQEKWDIQTQFISLVDAPLDLKPYIPDFKYNLQDISHIPDEKIKGSILLQILLKTLKYIFTPELRDKLPGILKLFKKLLDKNRVSEYFKALTAYLTSSAKQMKKKELDKIITEAYDQGGDIMQTIAEGWLKEGRKEGEKRGKREVAKNLKMKGIDIETIAETTGLSKQEIAKL
ncbi:MAG: Rpn family recombination-promoting nuclease/putative transposase [bacterium]|nr:Rpn family recombination-promoting nuclease/putative transposase [bacterium]